jgi:hypothetical protein
MAAHHTPINHPGSDMAASAYTRSAHHATINHPGSDMVASKHNQTLIYPNKNRNKFSYNHTNEIFKSQFSWLLIMINN